jgi:WD40 repeat protein
MSSQPPECQSRAVAYCKELKHLAVANNVGIVTIREVDWAKVDAREPGSLDNIIKKNLFKEVKKAEWIEAMVYSPDAKWLAVGSHDNKIYLLDTKKYDDKKATKAKAILTGHSSFITSIDWCMESTYIRSNCGAYELLFFNIKKEAGKQRDPSGASNTVETMWSDQTCKLGWSVQGIFPPGTDGSHINSVAMSKDQKLIASGDDYGLVCLYRNPLLEGHKCSKYRGHSEFVTTVKFSDDNEYLFSTGGQDQTCFQWKKQPKKKEEDSDE